MTVLHKVAKVTRSYNIKLGFEAKHAQKRLNQDFSLKNFRTSPMNSVLKKCLNFYLSCHRPEQINVIVTISTKFSKV